MAYASDQFGRRASSATIWLVADHHAEVGALANLAGLEPEIVAGSSIASRSAQSRAS
jgi:hypothetical protein